jgi:hypothetical protein
VLKYLKRYINLIVILIISAIVAEAEPARPQVSLLTVAPGKLVYELDGHTALRFRLPNGDDFIVNWGVFDFNAPNFLYRFVKGETDYMAWPFSTKDFLTEYRIEGREVTEQVINLTPEQASNLYRLVIENLMPQNREYRYNYIYDNCATRPLALIEKAIGYDINIPEVDNFVYGETGFRDPGGKHTFRREMARSHGDYPWYQFGIDLALGNGLDKQITPRERTYYPLYLREALRNATYTDGYNAKHYLVSSTKTLLPAGGRVTEQPTPWYLTPLFAAILVMLLTAYVATTDLRRSALRRWYDTIVYSLFFLLSLLLTFLIFVSVHEASSPNWLYLWLNPLSIIPALLIWLKSCKRVVYCYQICNFAALFLLLVIGIFQVQALNAAFYPLIASSMMLSARYIIITRRNQRGK